MKYTAPEMEIVFFDSDSVIVASETTTTFDDVIGSDELP